jgi:hypothetical protein
MSTRYLRTVAGLKIALPYNFLNTVMARKNNCHNFFANADNVTAKK